MIDLLSHGRGDIDSALKKEYGALVLIRCNEREGRESTKERCPLLTVTFLKQAQ